MQVLNVKFMSRVALAAVSVGLAGTGAAWAQGSASAPQAKSQWSVTVGAAVASVAQYEGADRRSSALVPLIDVSYQTRDCGRFGFGIKQRGLNWTPIETEQYSIALILGSDMGRRDDKKGNLFQPGSESLRGMGQVKSSGEAGLLAQANVGAGLALSAQFMHSTGKRKLAGNGDLESHGGTHASFGLELPWKLSQQFSASIGAEAQWANADHMQAYFGVTAAQAARTKFRAYTPGAGIKSLSLSLSANYAIDANWSATSTLSWSQLRGDAAASPIVQRKNSTTLMAGLVHRF